MGTGLRRCVVVAISLSGCDSGTDDYQTIYESARCALPIAVEMEDLFGSASHTIVHYGMRDRQTNDWITTVYFGERYELTMQVKVEVCYRSKRVRAVGEPLLILAEAERVTRFADGRAAMERGRIFVLTHDQWSALHESGGDFSAIGIELNSEPVPDFSEYVDQCRQERILVSLTR